MHSVLRLKVSNLRGSLHKEVQLILNNLDKQYNDSMVHSTTEEIPCIRFQRAIREKRTLFREFTIRPPFKSTKDIFCLKVGRTVDSYRKVSINKLELKIPSDHCMRTYNFGLVQTKKMVYWK